MPQQTQGVSISVAVNVIYFARRKSHPLTAPPRRPTLLTRLSRGASNLALSVVANGAIVVCVAAPRGINSLMTVSEGVEGGRGRRRGTDGVAAPYTKDKFE